MARTKLTLLLIDLLDDTSRLRNVQRTHVIVRPRAVVAATSADTLLNAATCAKANVSRKRMRALGYDVTYWLLRSHEHSAALVQDRLFTVLYQAIPGSIPFAPRAALLSSGGLAIVVFLQSCDGCFLAVLRWQLFLEPTMSYLVWGVMEDHEGGAKKG
jgi:hypothetical protein